MAIPSVDLDLHPERGVGVAVPAHLRKTLRVAPEHGNVGTVLAVDRDPPAERDVADDGIAGHWTAALGQAEHDLVDPLDRDPEA